MIKEKKYLEIICENINLANNFYNCAVNYYNSEEFEVKGFFPYIVNISFSIELLLKTLLYYYKDISFDEMKKISHSLYELYEKIPTSIKDNISSDLHEYDIIYELERAETIFADVRYYYLNMLFSDKKKFSTNPIFLKKLCESLIKECKKEIIKN